MLSAQLLMQLQRTHNSQASVTSKYWQSSNHLLLQLRQTALVKLEENQALDTCKINSENETHIKPGFHSNASNAHKPLHMKNYAVK